MHENVCAAVVAERRMLALREREIRAKEREARELDRASRWQVCLMLNTPGAYLRGNYPQGCYPQVYPVTGPPQVVPVVTIYQ